jgi:hypothetical protein
MNITVNVSDVALDTIVAEVFGYDSETGDEYQIGNKTIADLVARQIVERLIKDDRYTTLAHYVTDIRKEVIRDAIRPAVEEAIAAPIRRTNTWGDPVGETVTTLREVIVKEAREVINAKDPNDYRGDKGTFLERTVRAEVAKAMHDEIVAEVAKAREAVAGEIGKQVATAVTNAMKGR